ncbi:MAG: hypothetical protein H6635_15470 [Anaerolineales bacterium]|nr:hypothetical protein [Anaerolineales bacterium]MCB9146760.1 hypothetical protein [Anaerolineales bacterium]
MKALNCPNCGAALPAPSLKEDIALCEYCGTSFRISKNLTPQPDLGNLILGADFSQKHMPGWETVNEEMLSFHNGQTPELRGKFKPHGNSYNLLKSSGFMDNFDVSVSITFYSGEKERIHAGLFLRYDPAVGGYGVKISVQGSYTFGYIAKDDEGQLSFFKIMPWAYHTALRSGLNEPNRLRVICNGNSFRVYLNGVFATSFQDDRYKMGKIFLEADSTLKSSLELGFSNLQVREVPGL